MTLVLKDLDLDPKRYQPGAGPPLGLQPQERAARTPRSRRQDTHNKFEEAYAAAYTLYQRRLREANALDFDDS